MNKIHRTVWSETRQAYVVAHENAAAHGKPSSSRKAIVGAVASALLVLGGQQAMAVSNCSTHGTIIFDGTVTTAANATGVCNLANGDVLTVTGSMTQTSNVDLTNVTHVGGEVSAPAVFVNDGITVNSITVGSNGTISGNAAIQIGVGTVGGTLTGNLVNAGQIIGKDGTAIAILGDVSGPAADPTGPFSVIGAIINTTTGTISGDAYGIRGIAFTLNGITNSGLIQSVGAPGVGSAAIDLNEADFGTASIVNTDTGLITVTGSNANVVSISNSHLWSFENAGRIIGLTGGAVYIAESVISHGVTNTGTLGGRYGFYVQGSDIQNGITNTGSMTGDDFGFYASSHTISGGITNSGLISGAATGMYIGAWSAGQSIAGDIVNSGTIQGGATGISVWGPNAVSLDGSLVNTGTITGGSKGIVLTGVTSSGGINNSGLISGGVTGIQLKDAVARGTNLTGGINNSGQIIGGTYALKSAANSALTIENTGLVSGRLNLLGNSTINNAGVVALPVGSSTMTGNFNNLAPAGGERGGILRMQVNTLASYAKLTVSGTIAANTGSVVDMQLARTHDVTVGGTLAGVMTAGTYAGQLAGSTVTGGIRDNSVLFDFTGIKSGNNLDLVVLAGSGDCAGPIANARTGPCEIGFDSTTKSLTVDASGSVTNGDIGVHFLSGLIGADSASLTNAGSISGNVTGLRIDSGTVAGGIANSGTITGGVYAMASEYGAIADIANTNTGVISGKLDLRGSGNFSNTGTLNLPAGNSYIGGNFTNTGTFSTSITNNATYGKLLVNGNVNLGGTIKADNTNAVGLNAGTLTGVIHYTGTRTNQFASVIGANDLFTWTALYDDSNKNVNLVATAASNSDFLSPVIGSPAAGAGTALNRIRASDRNNPVILSFATVPRAQIPNAINQTLPLLVGGSQVAASAALTGMNRVIQARIESNRGLSSGEDFYGDKKFWMKPFGSWADQNDHKGVSGYYAKTGGVAFGADGTISKTTRLGLSFAYAKASVEGNSNAAPNSANVDVYQLIGYGSYSLDQDTEVNFQGGIGQNKNKGRRNLLAFGTRAHANFDSLVATVGAGLGRTYRQNETTSFTPSIRADYTWIKDEGYTETGAGWLNNDVKGRSADELILAIDGKLSHELEKGATLTANLGLGYDLLNDQASITSAYVGAPTVAFKTKGLDPSPWLVRGGLGIVSNTESGLEISARYDVEHRTDFLNQTASVKLRWAF